MLRSAALLALVLLAACTPQRRDGSDETPSCPAVRQCANDVCCEAGQKCDEAGAECVACEATTCAAEGWSCGTLEDGCGGTLSCGSCPDGFECGDAHKCVAAPCRRKTCATAGADCGTVADGCGGRLTCGSCANGMTCGGGGGPNRCGNGPCTAENDIGMCARLGQECGVLVDFDNCGNSRSIPSCGQCDEFSVCGGTLCVCTGETPQSLCSKNPTACGEVQLLDRCGVVRTVDCGRCSGVGSGAGAACADPNDCADPLFCLSESSASVPGGMCTKPCSATDACPGDGVCVPIDSLSLCAAPCVGDGDCRDQFVCHEGGCLPTGALSP